MTRIILVRHGQTEWNRVERFRGRIDVPLNETGIAQAEATGKQVAKMWQPTAIYSSPLSRSFRTAQAIANHFNLDVQAHSDLVDLNFGEWEGLTPDEVKQRWPDQAEKWFYRPEEAQIPGGETLAELRGRAIRAIFELVRKHPDDTILLVGHRDINRIILLGILGLENKLFWHLRQDNCAINVFDVQGTEAVLVLMNDTCHLI